MYAADPYAAAAGSEALLILTEWREFASLDLARLRAALKYPIVIDGRNLYEPSQMADAGLTYHSVGRPVGAPEHVPSAKHLKLGIPVQQGTERAASAF
jgi:UDPglucose 6-dehydrogenase